MAHQGECEKNDGWESSEPSGAASVDACANACFGTVTVMNMPTYTFKSAGMWTKYVDAPDGNGRVALSSKLYRSNLADECAARCVYAGFVEGFMLGKSGQYDQKCYCKINGVDETTSSGFDTTNFDIYDINEDTSTREVPALGFVFKPGSCWCEANPSHPDPDCQWLHPGDRYVRYDFTGENKAQGSNGYIIREYEDNVYRHTDFTTPYKNPKPCEIDTYLSYPDMDKDCHCPIWHFEESMVDDYSFVQETQTEVTWNFPEGGKERVATDSPYYRVSVVDECAARCTAENYALGFMVGVGGAFLDSCYCRGGNETSFLDAIIEMIDVYKFVSPKVYSIPLDDDRANLHACIEECTTLKKRTARVERAQNFTCFCGDTYTNAYSFKSPGMWTKYVDAPGGNRRVPLHDIYHRDSLPQECAIRCVAGGYMEGFMLGKSGQYDQKCYCKINGVDDVQESTWFTTTHFDIYIINDINGMSEGYKLSHTRFARAQFEGGACSGEFEMITDPEECKLAAEIIGGMPTTVENPSVLPNSYCTESAQEYGGDATLCAREGCGHYEYGEYDLLIMGYHTEASTRPQYSTQLCKHKQECKCPGFYMRAGHAYSCKAGTYSDGACSSRCKMCPVGKWSEEGATSCDVCAAGKIQASETSCMDCPEGYFSSEGDSQCTECASGKFASEGSAVCSDCPGGKYAQEGSSGCVDCASGKFSRSGDMSCTDCAAGRYSISGSSSCTTCPDGWAQSSVGATACYKCTAGYFSYPPSNGCPACPAGKFSNAEAKFCSDCEVGQYQNVQGQASCKSCGSPKSGFTFVSTFEKGVALEEEEACDQVKRCPPKDTEGVPKCYDVRMAGACDEYPGGGNGDECRQCCWERIGSLQQSCDWHAERWGGEADINGARGFETLTGMDTDDGGIVWCQPKDYGF